MQRLGERGKAVMKNHGRQAARFGVVGVLCAITDFGLFAVLVALDVAVIPANIASFLVANMQGYVLNAKFSFGEGGAHALSARGYLKFFMAYAASLALSTLVVGLLAAPIGPLPAKVIATGLGAILNYLTSAYVVFRRSGENPAEETPPESP
jgi:putative flippase GtrA